MNSQYCSPLAEGGVSRRRVTPVVLLISMSATCLMAPSASAAGPEGEPWNRSEVSRCGSAVPGDVNGDGYAEVVVGEPGSSDGRGAVHVLYGHRRGLVVKAAGTALDDQYFTQSSRGVPGVAEVGGSFGSSNALGDFNADGCADLAVAAPGEMVVVLYGSTRGITTGGAQSFTLSELVGAEGEPGHRFGSALAVGDLNDDGVSDLAIGVPEMGATHGAVVVAFGDEEGLNRGTTGAAVLGHDPAGTPGIGGWFFGYALATGDFDGDGVTELAIGVPGADVAKKTFAGVVRVVEGGPGGFRTAEAVTLSQDTSGVPGKAGYFETFGAALASGDVTGDGRADLAVGAPGENAPGDLSGFFGEGAVNLFLGSAAGLTGQGGQHWSRHTRGVEGAASAEGNFGRSLAIAPLDAGPNADLAIGSPGDHSDSIGHSFGSVTVLLGSRTGLTTDGMGGRRFHQNTPGIAGSAEPGDGFGLTVATSFVQGADRASLIVGVPFESVQGVSGAGLIHQLAATASGPNPKGSRAFHLNTTGLKGTPEGHDHFGDSGYTPDTA